jgi:hypothetical protein
MTQLSVAELPTGTLLSHPFGRVSDEMNRGMGRAMDQEKLEECSAAELTDVVGQLHAAGCAIHRALLDVVVAVDCRGVWKDDGASSMAAWLTARLGLAYSSATQWVQVAHDLASLPALSAAYGEGRLSWDQLVAVVSVASRPTKRWLTKHRLAQQPSSKALVARLGVSATKRSLKLIAVAFCVGDGTTANRAYVSTDGSTAPKEQRWPRRFTA